MSSNANSRLFLRFQNFKKAFHLYESAIQPKLSVLEQEGLIQRFEYTFELAWKCMQDLLTERGYANIKGPRPVIEQCFQDGVITDGVIWLEMLQSRNETSHLYDEATFKRTSEKVQGNYLHLLKKFEKDFSQWVKP